MSATSITVSGGSSVSRSTTSSPAWRVREPSFGFPTTTVVLMSLPCAWIRQKWRRGAQGTGDQAGVTVTGTPA